LKPLFDKPSQACIGLGGNLDHPEAILRQALKALDRVSEVCVLKIASFYQTPPLGFASSESVPDFINTVALLETSLTPDELLSCLLELESEFGRERPSDGHMASRTLDLDLLFYDDVRVQHSDLELPHPRLHERAFVLLPLCEIVPQWIHPDFSQTCEELLEALPISALEGIQKLTSFSLTV